jgi:hypothetical protein
MDGKAGPMPGREEMGITPETKIRDTGAMSGAEGEQIAVRNETIPKLPRILI